MNITEHHPNEPQIWRVLLDEEFKAKLKIVKKDDETKKSVLIAGTEFKVYDLDNKKYVEQVTTNPVTTTHKSYFTDSQGYLIMPKNLKIGHYRNNGISALRIHLVCCVCIHRNLYIVLVDCVPFRCGI